MDKIQFCKFISCDETRFTLMVFSHRLFFNFLSSIISFPPVSYNRWELDDNQFHSFQWTILLHASDDFLIKCWS